MKKLIFGIAFLVGIFIPPVVFIHSIVTSFGPDHPFDAPGKIEIEIEKNGQCYVWDHTAVPSKDMVANRPLLPEAKVSLTAEKVNANFSLPFHPLRGVWSNTNGEKKAMVGFFAIPHPGKYVLQVNGLNEPHIFSYSMKDFSDIAVKLIIMAVLMGVFFLIGLTFSILGIVEMVRKGKREVSPPPL